MQSTMWFKGGAVIFTKRTVRDNAKIVKGSSKFKLNLERKCVGRDLGPEGIPTVETM